MTEQEHQFFFHAMKDFNTAASFLKSAAAGIRQLESALVEYDNKFASLEKQYKAKEEEFEKLDKAIKESRIMRDRGHDEQAAFLQKKHLDLVEREARLAVKERVVEEQQKKVNELLVAAESKPTRKKVEA